MRITSTHGWRGSKKVFCYTNSTVSQKLGSKIYFLIIHFYSHVLFFLCLHLYTIASLHICICSCSYRTPWIEAFVVNMENTSIPRPMTSARRVAAPTPARAHITRPVATPRPQTQERKNTGGPSLVRPGVGAATSSTRLTKAHNHPGVTAPTQLPPSGPANRSRQTPVQQSGEKPTPPSRNFSRPGAAPLATRRQPAIAAQRVHQVGFENWALRHESVAALPQPARGSDYAREGIERSFKGRVHSLE